MSSVRLAEDQLDVLADAVARRILENLTAPSADDGLLDAAETGRRLRHSRAWVYENADRLGAIRIGNGPRPRLRFDPEVIAAQLEPKQPTLPPRRRTTARGTRTALLPIGGIE